jgi:hypothetical protein
MKLLDGVWSETCKVFRLRRARRIENEGILMGIRVLVIEDDDEIADFVVRGLRKEGFTVESLLFLARGDSQALEPLLEPIDLSTWLFEHVRSWQETHGDSDSRLEIETEGPVPVPTQPSLFAELVNSTVSLRS